MSEIVMGVDPAIPNGDETVLMINRDGRQKIVRGEDLRKLHAHLDGFLCDDKADGTDICDACHGTIEVGRDVYFFSDGGFDSDGTYTCYECAVFRMVGQ